MKDNIEKSANAKREATSSVIILNVSELNFPQQQKLEAWIINKKIDSPICCLQETNFTTKDTKKLKVIGWKKIFYVSSSNKRPEVATITLDTIKLNTVTRL